MNRAIDKPAKTAIAKPAAKVAAKRNDTPADRPPAFRDDALITPSGAMTLRAGSARARVLAALQQAPRPRGKLAQLLIDVGGKTLDNVLFSLRVDGLINRPKDRGAAWTITPSGSELLNTLQPGAAPAKPAQPSPAAPPATPAQHAPKTVEQWTNEVAEALERMRIVTEQASQRHEIADLELKDFTLKSLAHLTHPAIARVLERIRDDLKAAA